jgi:hypothetical protein
MVESSGFLCVQIMMPVQGEVALGQHHGIIEFRVSQTFWLMLEEDLH